MVSTCEEPKKIEIVGVGINGLKGIGRWVFFIFFILAYVTGIARNKVSERSEEANETPRTSSLAVSG